MEEQKNKHSEQIEELEKDILKHKTDKVEMVKELQEARKKMRQILLTNDNDKKQADQLWIDYQNLE